MNVFCCSRYAGALRSTVAGAMAVLMALPASNALAQAPSTIEEIVVTARKRVENLQDVPMAITAFTADTIEEAGIDDLYDVAELTPGLSFFNAQGEFLPVPVIRGVAPTDIFGESNAAIFVDGIYVSGREGLNFSQLDLARIEVVKGPQSALYGRNAFSGAINYITKDPSNEFGMQTEVTGGTDGRLTGTVSLTGPIFTDELTGRISALYEDFDGTYENSLGGQDIGGHRFRSFQGKLLWAPTDVFDIAGALYYSNDEIDISPATSYFANCQNRVDGNLNITRPLTICGEVLSLDDYADVLRNIGTPTALSAANAFSDESIPKIARALGGDRELTRAHLSINLEVFGGTVTALTGFSDTRHSALVDGTRSLGNNQPFVYCTNAVPFQPNPAAPPFFYLCPGGPASLARLTTGLLQIDPEDQTREISQELRFTSDPDRPFRWSAGAYWYNVETDQVQRGLEATNQPPPPFPQQQFGPVVAGFPIIIGDAAFRPWFQPGGIVDPLHRHYREKDTSSWSVFTSADLDVTEALTLDAQLRYGEEDKEIKGFIWDPVNLAAESPVISASNEDTWDSLTWRLGAKLDITDNWMVYTSVARGEKAGGFDTNDVDYADAQGGAAILVTRFDSEELIATELGLKGRTADGRLRLDLAVFYSDWNDVVIPQVFETSPIDGRPFEQPASFLENLGNATVMGWEIAAGLYLTDNLTMRLSGSYTDATWDSGTRQSTLATFPAFRPADCQGPTTPATEPDCRARSGFIAGNAVLRQPEWQASSSLDYQRPLGDVWDLFARADVSYQSKVFVGNANLSYLPAHTYVNLKLGVESGRYSVVLWGRNIFSNDAPIAAYRDVSFGNTQDLYQQFAPVSTAEDFFPYRFTVTHPQHLAAYGITARMRFGSEVD